MQRRANRAFGVVCVLTAALVLGASNARAQGPAAADGAAAQPADPKPNYEIYGFAMLDIGHDFKQINPNWFDTMRVTKLPSSKDQFGRDHSAFASVRQGRLGVRTST